jgi:hypothetical protein
VNIVVNFGFHNGVNFLDQPSNYQLLKKNHGVPTREHYYVRGLKC